MKNLYKKCDVLKNLYEFSVMYCKRFHPKNAFYEKVKMITKRNVVLEYEKVKMITKRTVVLEYEKVKMITKGLLSLSPSSPLARLIVITPFWSSKNWKGL
jgi:hypothetical protein